jgi:glycosyltransferase involved in cell wall biosynthesis
MAPLVVHLIPAMFSKNGGILGGAERYVLELARHMAEVVPTRLVSFGPKTMRFREGSLEVHIIGRPWHVRGQHYNPLSLRLLPALMQATIIHCHQPHVMASNVAALFGRVTGKRIVATDLGGGAWSLSGYLNIDCWFHRHLHISEYSRQVYGHQDKSWASVILGGVDTEKFSPDPEVRQDGTVLFVGRLLPHKGVNDLLDAVGPDQPVELIGQPYHAAFLACLQEKAVGKCVRFRHDCDDAELVQAYRRAICVVLPSVYRSIYGDTTTVPELLGQTLIEGMACGTPAVCTAVASMPEVVEDGVTGFIVSPNDPAALGEKLRWLREHPAEAEQMGRNARQQVLDKFTWPEVVVRCLRAYGIDP